MGRHKNLPVSLCPGHYCVFRDSVRAEGISVACQVPEWIDLNTSLIHNIS